MILMPETWGSSRSSGFLYDEHSEYLRMGRSILVVMAMLVRRSITEMCDNALANLLRYFQNLVSEKSALLDPNQARQNNQIWRIDRQSSLNASSIDLSF